MKVTLKKTGRGSRREGYTRSGQYRGFVSKTSSTGQGKYKATRCDGATGSFPTLTAVRKWMGMGTCRR